MFYVQSFHNSLPGPRNCSVDKDMLMKKSFHQPSMRWLKSCLQKKCTETLSLVLCGEPARWAQASCKPLPCFSHFWHQPEVSLCFPEAVLIEAILESLTCVVVPHGITSQVPFSSRVKEHNINCFSIFPTPKHNASGPVGEDGVQKMVS